MIYTGYYGKLEEYEELGLTPVGISGQLPCWFEGYHFPFFAPSLDIFMKWKNGEIDNNGYIERFIPERLDVLNKEDVKEKLLQFENPILLCYEKDGFCHRHIVAEWIRQNLGLEVEEYEFNSNS